MGEDSRGAPLLGVPVGSLRMRFEYQKRYFRDGERKVWIIAPPMAAACCFWWVSNELHYGQPTSRRPISSLYLGPPRFAFVLTLLEDVFCESERERERERERFAWGSCWIFGWLSHWAFLSSEQGNWFRWNKIFSFNRWRSVDVSLCFVGLGYFSFFLSFFLLFFRFGLEKSEATSDDKLKWSRAADVNLSKR